MYFVKIKGGVIVFFFFSLLSLLPAYTRRSLLDYKDDVGVNDGLNSIAPISLKGVFKIVA